MGGEEFVWFLVASILTILILGVLFRNTNQGTQSGSSFVVQIIVYSILATIILNVILHAFPGTQNTQSFMLVL